MQRYYASHHFSVREYVDFFRTLAEKRSSRRKAKNCARYLNLGATANMFCSLEIYSHSGERSSANYAVENVPSRVLDMRNSAKNATTDLTAPAFDAPPK